MTQIMRIEVPQARRTEVASSIFGLHFPLSIEPYIYNLASSMSQQYQGGYWEFYQLSNGGLYVGLSEGREGESKILWNKLLSFPLE